MIVCGLDIGSTNVKVVLADEAGRTLWVKSVPTPHVNDGLGTTTDATVLMELLEDLKKVQGDTTPPFTFVMFVRALRCNLDPARAMEVAKQGLALYPEQVELLAEKLSLDDFSESMMPASGLQH